MNKLELLVIWSVAPKSMIQMEENDIRHVLGLPNSTCSVVGVETGFNNLANSYVKSTTDCSKVLLVDATWAY